MRRSVLTNDEAERQLVAAVARHEEALASMQESGRPEAGQHVAVKAVDRAVRLVCFALRRAAEAGIPTERLGELTGWQPERVAEGLARPDDPRFVATLVPETLDRSQIAHTAAAVSATARIHALTQQILAGVLEEEAWTPSPDQLDELHGRLAAAWTEWQTATRRRES